MNDQIVHIVIAEDHFFVCEEIERVLRYSGYTVIGETCNGEDAVQMVSELKPEVALMDNKKHNMYGLEASC
ncbi:response regulator [Desulfocicer niacini]